MEKQSVQSIVVIVVLTLALVFAIQYVGAHLRVSWIKPPAPSPVTPDTPPAPPQPKPKPVFPKAWLSERTPMPTPDFDVASLCGWFTDGGHLPHASAYPVLAECAPRLMAAAPSGQDPILLYKVFKEVFADYPDGGSWPAQQIGDCVSFGHGHGNDLAETIRVYLGDLPIEHVHATCTEFIYGTSREVGGILGRQDGSYGALAVKAMTTIGVLPRSAVGPYSGQRAKEWGLRGAPADMKTAAAAYKLGSAARVTTWDELIAAIGNGYPVTICTGQGFTLDRDSQGFCKARGSWGHCMFIAGVRFDRPGACIIQSWGPDVPSGPRDLDQPGNSFWAEQSPIERILGEGDSWALTGSPTFEPQSLPSVLTRG